MKTQTKKFVAAGASVGLLLAFLAVMRMSSCIAKHNETMTRWELMNPSKYKPGDVVNTKLEATRLLIDRVSRSGQRWRYLCKYIMVLGSYNHERTKWVWEHEISTLLEAGK